MSEDIVSQLRHLDKHFTEQWGTPGYPVVGAAADEIERLRQVGDKLAMHLDAFFGMLEPASNEITDVLKEWKEARRG